jgi:hypothetical protein
MKRFILACCLLLTSLGALAQDPDAATRQQVNLFIDEWHDDAAHARMAYFDKMAKDGVYIGTDKTELWHKDDFKAWARKYFERKSAWAFKRIERNVYVGADKHTIWFDELLDTAMGICRASGVIRKTASAAGGFEIEHYQLSIAVPNEVTAPVTKLIKEFEAKAAAR